MLRRLHLGLLAAHAALTDVQKGAQLARQWCAKLPYHRRQYRRRRSARSAEFSRDRAQRDGTRPAARVGRTLMVNAGSRALARRSTISSAKSSRFTKQRLIMNDAAAAWSARGGGASGVCLPQPLSDAGRPSTQEAVIAMLRRPEWTMVDEPCRRGCGDRRSPRLVGDIHGP